MTIYFVFYVFCCGNLLSSFIVNTEDGCSRMLKYILKMIKILILFPEPYWDSWRTIKRNYLEMWSAALWNWRERSHTSCSMKHIIILTYCRTIQEGSLSMDLEVRLGYVEKKKSHLTFHETRYITDTTELHKLSNTNSWSQKKKKNSKYACILDRTTYL